MLDDRTSPPAASSDEGRDAAVPVAPPQWSAGGAPGEKGPAVAGDDATSDLSRLVRELVRVPGVEQPSPSSFEFRGTERFRVVRRLGSGGFGIVWLVHDASVGMDVALKTIPPGRPELVYRLKREFRALADLRHENLVAYYELFSQQDDCYFTMEYVPGCTFLQYVRPSGKLDPERLRGALGQLVRGLSALHAAGKLHRDIKPSNVLVRNDGRVVLLDFGLATQLEEGDAARTAELAGTPEYMSPEHALSEPLSPASDWYSVGVMLYQSLTGQVPFKGSWGKIIDSKVHSPDLPSPDSLCPGLDRAFVETCMALLSREPAKRPGAAALASLVGDGVVREPTRRDVSEEQLVGREEELRRLRSAFWAARRGQGTVVLVEGASGIGKTALVRTFLSWAKRDEHAVVLRGRCYERERVPYQGIDSLVDNLSQFLAGAGVSEVEAILPRHLTVLLQLFPALERVPAIASHRRPGAAVVDQQELRRQAFVALRELLARGSDRFPLVLHVDDLQWGDLDSAALLQELMRPPDSPALLLVLSYRSEDAERSGCLRALARAPLGDVVTIRLGPLGSVAAQELALRFLRGNEDHVDIARVAKEAGGSPLFIQELSRYALLVGGTQEGASVDLRTALRVRIERLSAEARLLLELVAVSGHPTSEAVMRQIIAPAGSSWESWDELRHGNLVRFSGMPGSRQVETFHDAIREAVVAGLPRDRLAQHHGALALALEREEGTDPEVLARHHAGAGRLPRARELAVAAAAQAQRALAFDRAVRLLTWAISVTPEHGGGDGPLLASLGDALANAGRGSEAARVYLKAADAAPLPAARELRRRAAAQLFLTGRIDEGLSLATEDLRATGMAFTKSPLRALLLLLLRRLYLRVRGLSFEERAEAGIERSRLALIDHLWDLDRGLSMVDVVRGADFGARHMILALRAGEPRRVAQGLALEAGHQAVVRPGSRRTQALIERVDRLDERLRDPRLHGHAQLVRAIRAYGAGQWKEAVALCDESVRTFQDNCTGAVWEIWTMRSFAATSLFYLGEWRDLRRRVETQAIEARDRGNVYGLTVTYMPYGVVGLLAAGDVQGARSATREVKESWSLRGFHLQHFWFLLSESLLDLHEGDGVRAWIRIQERWPPLSRSMLPRIPSVRTPSLFLRTVIALTAIDGIGGERDAMVREARGALRLLERSKHSTAVPFAMLARAALASREGRQDDAARELERASADLERRQMFAYGAAARLQLECLRSKVPPTDFLPGQAVANPVAVMRMLVPGFPLP